MNTRLHVSALTLLAGLPCCGEARPAEHASPSVAAPAETPRTAEEAVAPNVQSDAIVAYAGSCKDRSKRAVMEPDWQAALPAGALARFTPAREVTLGGTPRKVDALLVPRSGPFADAVLARSGDTIYSPYESCDPARLPR